MVKTKPCYKKIQLVYPKHESGELAHASQANMPPPLGLLTLAAYAGSSFPDVEIEVWDGNRIDETCLLQQLDAPLVGISVWFSNYSAGRRLAEQVRRQNQRAKIIMGGPHANGMERRILSNNPSIDFVCSGDGELALTELLNGTAVENIPGFSYRSSDGDIHTNSSHQTLLDTIPPISFDPLETEYRWRDDAANSSAFPLSGVRGCARVKRCEYCSIYTVGVRKRSPERFWQEVQSLRTRYGIHRFFETGDIFPSDYAASLAKTIPVDNPDVAFRVYLYPGMARDQNVRNLAKIGVDNAFIGAESALVWRRQMQRKMAQVYTPDSLEREVDLLWQYGISTMASFILGLPGEDAVSLAENERMIRSIGNMAGTYELLINTLIPLPNTAYFDRCVANTNVVRRYSERMGEDLRTTDVIDYHLLGRLFVEEFTAVPWDAIVKEIMQLQEEFGAKVANWGMTDGKI